MHVSSRRLMVVALCLLPAFIVVGCTPAQYAEQADRAAYDVIDQKQTLALGTQQPFTIEYGPFAEADGENRPLLRDKPIPMGDEPVRILSLSECLEIAFRNSREFQNSKEDLYIEALALANQRYDWSGFGGLATADVSRSVTEGGDTVNAAEGEVAPSFTQRLAQGGIITLGAALTLSSDLLGINSTEFGSELAASLIQPLWRGAWRDFAYEDLYRDERNLAISVLEFERFTQTFSTDITTQYYEVLQRLDQLGNEQANIVRLEQALRRTRIQVEGGQISRIGQDQTEQSVLQGRVRFAELSQRYRTELDRYKITLGLPVRSNVELDPDELIQLGTQIPPPIPFLDEEAVNRLADQAAAKRAAAYDRENPSADGDDITQRVRKTVIERRRLEAYEQLRDDYVVEAVARATDIALHTRPAVLRELANIRDVGRDVEIAADRFNPRVDLKLSISASGAEPRKPFRVQLHRSTRTAQLVVNYPLDQTDNRDAYRAALLTQARRLRDYAQFLDEVRLNVRDAYRQLIRARQTYDIERRNVAVAERRQRLAALQQANGEASARDVLEAEDDLRTAQNGLTGAVVTYETTRIRFLASLGMLDVDRQGQYSQRETPFLFTRLGERYGNVEDIQN